jgi:hypothetical protein
VPWSGAPDSPVCHRTVSGAPPDSVQCTRVDQLKLFTFGFPRRTSAIIHRTVRCNTRQCPVAHRTVQCASGATAISVQRSTLQGEQCNSECQSRSQRGIGLSGATPDCPVPQEDRASNGRPAPSPNGRLTWRRTKHCLVRPSPAAFSNGYNLVGGYKYHPNRPLQRVGAQATFQVICLTYSSPPNHLYSLIHPIHKI